MQETLEDFYAASAEGTQRIAEALAPAVKMLSDLGSADLSGEIAKELAGWVMDTTLADTYRP